MSEELKAAQARIACLEGEIAKRDEELAACRVAVENCDLFRARIAEIEADRDSHQRCAIQAMAELAAIKAQEQVAYIPVDRKFLEEIADSLDYDVRDVRDKVRSLLAAPVSEAKAQGVVMPERWNVPRPMWKDARQPYGNPLNHADIEAAEKFNLALDEVARLNAAPVQQVSVPDERIIPTSAEIIQWAWEEEPEETRFQEGYNAAKRWVKMQIEAGIAAPAAPASPAADASPENCRQRLASEGKPYPKSSCAACGQFSPKWRECDAALAAHRAQGVV